MSLAGRALAVATVVGVVACGSDDGPSGSPPDADRLTDSSAIEDAGVPVPDATEPSTWVEGTLGGSTFVLVYAAYAPVDMYLNDLCISNVPIVAPDCGYSDGLPKVVIYGRFYMDTSGMSRWANPVEINRFGSSPAFELAESHSLTLHSFDPAAGTLAGSLEIGFPSGPSRGTVSIP